MQYAKLREVAVLAEGSFVSHSNWNYFAIQLIADLNISPAHRSLSACDRQLADRERSR
jgi:hypothetical protein